MVREYDPDPGVSMSEENGILLNPPTLPALLQRHKRNIFQTLNCCKVGVIQTFDAVKRRAAVQIVFSRVLAVPSTDGKQVQDYPVLLECPVFTLQGGGGYLSMPVAKGDECLVLFSDSDMDAWLEQGSAKPSVPYSARRHDLSDGIVLVGLNSVPKPLSPAVTASEVSLSYSGAKIAEKGGKVDISNATVNFITAMDTFLTVLGADSVVLPATKAAATALKVSLDTLFY